MWSPNLCGASQSIVNEAFARTYFDGQNPVGRMVAVREGRNLFAAMEIVGYVRDFLLQQRPRKCPAYSLTICDRRALHKVLDCLQQFLNLPTDGSAPEAVPVAWCDPSDQAEDG